MRWNRTSRAFCALALLASCATGDDDDDDLTPPAASDDDDATDEPAEPSLTFDPASVRAGDLLDVVATASHFELTDPLYACCADEDVVLVRFLGRPSPDSLALRFFFGLFAPETVSWGIDNGAGQLVADFTVAPLAPPTSLPVGVAAATGDLAEAGDFGVFALEAVEGSFVALQIRPDDPDALRPWLWVLGEDGRRSVAAAGFEDGDGGYFPPYTVFRPRQSGVLYLRVQDNHLGGGEGFGYAVDHAVIDPGPVVESVESEPNSSVDEAEELGALAIGRYSVSGVADAAGHDEDNDLAGDLELFAFTVEQDSRVRFALDWPGDDDFDAVLYDATAPVELGFGSDQALTLSLASTRHPEVATLSLSAGIPYLLQVGNWEGSPDAAWTLSLDVMPGSFPE